MSHKYHFFTKLHKSQRYGIFHHTVFCIKSVTTSSQVAFCIVCCNNDFCDWFQNRSIAALAAVASSIKSMSVYFFTVANISLAVPHLLDNARSSKSWNQLFVSAQLATSSRNDVRSLYSSSFCACWGQAISFNIFFTSFLHCLIIGSTLLLTSFAVFSKLINLSNDVLQSNKLLKLFSALIKLFIILCNASISLFAIIFTFQGIVSSTNCQGTVDGTTCMLYFSNDWPILSVNHTNCSLLTLAFSTTFLISPISDHTSCNCWISCCLACFALATANSYTQGAVSDSFCALIAATYSLHKSSFHASLFATHLSNP